MNAPASAASNQFEAPSAALRPDGRCSRLPHFVGEAKTGSVPQSHSVGEAKKGVSHAF